MNNSDNSFWEALDSEIKVLIGCTEEEKQLIYQTHNETPYMKGIIIRR